MPVSLTIRVASGPGLWYLGLQSLFFRHSVLSAVFRPLATDHRQLNSDASARRRVGDRVADEDAQDLGQAVFIAADQDLVRGVDLEGLAGLSRQRPHRLDRLPHDRRKVEHLRFQRQPAGIGPRQDQQLVDQPGHPVRLVEDRGQLDIPFLRRRVGHPLHQFRIGPDHRQRCAQLVRGIGDKGLLAAEGAVDWPHRPLGQVEPGRDRPQCADRRPGQRRQLDRPDRRVQSFWLRTIWTAPTTR